MKLQKQAICRSGSSSSALMASYAHHRFCSSSPCASSPIPLRLTALSFSLPPAHSPSRLRLFLPSRFPARSSFNSLFLTSLPSPLIPRCAKHSHLPIACISSSAFTYGAGGDGIGHDGGSGGGGGGGQGGGDGFVAHGTGTQSLNPESDDISIANSVEDYIFLDVGGMSCGGCASSVKKILESQPHVLHASVNLATETAVVKVSLGTELTPNKNWMLVKLWQNICLGVGSHQV